MACSFGGVSRAQNGRRTERRARVCGAHLSYVVVPPIVLPNVVQVLLVPGAGKGATHELPAGDALPADVHQRDDVAPHGCEVPRESETVSQAGTAEFETPGAHATTELLAGLTRWQHTLRFDKDPVQDAGGQAQQGRARHARSGCLQRRRACLRGGSWCVWMQGLLPPDVYKAFNALRAWK